MILKEAETSGQQLDHLGLVASVIKRLKLIERIDARVPVSKEKGAKVSIGQRVAAMILNGLGFRDDRLYLFPEFLANKPIARLIAPGLVAADFNDDALGRGLDALFNYGETKLFSELAFHIGVEEQLLGPTAHFDTTSLSLSREIKTLKRRIAEEQASYKKSLWHLSHEIFQCEHDALTAGAELIKKLKYHEVSWTVKTTEKHNKAGRPKKDANPMVIGYQIEGTLLENKERIAKFTAQKGRFILASNELDTEKLSDEAILPTYKEQIKTEQGFKFIKNDTFEVDSVFLKTPSRIQALMMVMTRCLMVYSVAQFHLRQALEQEQNTIPDQKKKPTKIPSMAWVFRLFQGIQLWIIRKDDLMQELVVNLNDLTRRIIQYFGAEAKAIYTSSG
jgi:transposase